ncbi:AAA family ATPase [Fibrella sp. HMF5335]|uniref:AAA family ATPase n=1 Tax=Fibrella rubiginis TaxID=2817060 RepID=A0A939GE91_9BACT|nr:AAA family ATPase [Fibrella rubiginis]MBO0934952.1 AAA family ATPase [Fibrella rubiginis]
MSNQRTINDLFITHDLDREFPLAAYFVHTYGHYPNYLFTHEDYKADLHQWLLSRGFAVINQSVRLSKEGFRNNGRIYQHPDGVMLEGEFIADSYCRLSGFFQTEAALHTTLAGIEDLIYEHEPEQTHIYLIQSGLGGLHTERVDIQPPEIDLDLYYNDGFVDVHDRLVALLNRPKYKGLILLHGEPGTGKTTYIKYLSSQVRKNMLILPPYMTNYLTSPDLIPFLLEQRDSVLIIEDAERILQAREAGGDTNSVSNILNLTDGLLADCLHIQIIATFNANKSLLDKALLRKGRLMVDYAFGKLATPKANALMSSLGVNYHTDVPMTLADIFNTEEQTISGDRVEGVRVGF